MKRNVFDICDRESPKTIIRSHCHIFERPVFKYNENNPFFLIFPPQNKFVSLPRHSPLSFAAGKDPRREIDPNRLAAGQKNIPAAIMRQGYFLKKGFA